MIGMLLVSRTFKVVRMPSSPRHHDIDDHEVRMFRFQNFKAS